jgi:NADH-quinone oxidoreductase subunit L
MESTLTVALAVTQGPLAAFGAIIVLTRGRPRLSAGIALLAAGVSLAGALLLFFVPGQQTTLHTTTWVASGSFSLPFGVLLDPLSRLMLLIVATVSFLVQLYSLGYMAGDPGFGRYYAFLSLFAWAMLSLTASPTLLQLYIFWELVGVSSYLLIGFWFEKWSASDAGKKAFVMTRTGDVLFFLGLLVLLVHAGTLAIPELNAPAIAGRLSPALITLAVLLIFGGVVGKSAQFPLLTWLPDAMEGPTPVSALLHSATMVAAGVYLVARLFPFFSLAPGALTVVRLVGTLSLLLASSMALVSRDIKQVWAYSTISQLGFMLMALASGSLFAGVFHLTTHAGFKALLFLCSGVFIHACGSNDVFEIARQGGRRQALALGCLVVAAAALAGLPPFSGFYSKERILAALAALPNPLWLYAALLGAFLTAYYAFRTIFIILSPPAVSHAAADGSEDHGHARHGAGRVMGAPLLVLALLTLTLGFCEAPLEGFLGAGGHGHAPAGAGWLVPTALGLALSGVLLAFVEFGWRGAPRRGFAERVPSLRRLFAERWYLDRGYRWLLERVVYRVFSAACAAGDRHVIDAGLDGMSRGLGGLGLRLSRAHTGMIQGRLLALFAAVAVMTVALLF